MPTALIIALLVFHSSSITQDPSPTRPSLIERRPAVQTPNPDRVATLLHLSQAHWEEELERVRQDFQAHPAEVLTQLIAALADDTVVSGSREESTMYTVRGNALTVLEDYCDLRLDAMHREWIGFRVHDHRGLAPDLNAVKQPWDAWLRSREGLAPEHWFYGLSARELYPLQKLLRSESKEWSSESLAPAVALGARAYPFLLARLVDEEWAYKGERQADQANRLLARLHGGEPEPLERYDLLTLAPDDPLRSERIALVRNRLALDRVQERWYVRLLAPPQ